MPLAPSNVKRIILQENIFTEPDDGSFQGKMTNCLAANAEGAFYGKLYGSI